MAGDPERTLIDRIERALIAPRLRYLIEPVHTLLQYDAGERAGLTEEADKYISRFHEIDQIVAGVIDHPKQVFFNEAPYAGTPMQLRFTDRDKPPSEVGGVNLTESPLITPLPLDTMRHLTSLVASRGNLTKEEIGRLLRMVDKGFFKNPVNRLDPIDLTVGKWELIMNYGRSQVTAFLVPVEQDYFSEDYVEHRLEQLAAQVQPQQVQKLVREAAANNYTVSQVLVNEPAQLFNLGGLENLYAINNSVEQAGWKLIDESTVDQLEDRRRIFEYAFTGAEPVQDLILLLRLTSYANDYYDSLKIIACPTRELQEEFYREFMKKFHLKVDHTIEERIRIGTEETVNLNPASLAQAVLTDLKQTLTQEEREQELPRLCKEAVVKLIARFRRYEHPVLKTITSDLELGVASQERLREITKSGMKINTGWDATKILLPLPRTYFQSEIDPT